jgi:tRNA dimethylallyltransferase
LLAQSATPIVVGGTGLYLRAALAELSLRPPPAPGVREALVARLERDGPAVLHAELSAVAPATAAAIAATDRQRIVRALELLVDTGAALQGTGGALQSGPPNPQSAARGQLSELWTEEMRHPTLLVGLTLERSRLYAQIDARVDAMVAAGAREEVLRADAAGAGQTARKALGFEQLLIGDVEAMKTRTRQYARRQLTWMRKLPNVTVLDVTDRDAAAVAAEVASLIGR